MVGIGLVYYAFMLATGRSLTMPGSEAGGTPADGT
jgi:hypothetical protein